MVFVPKCLTTQTTVTPYEVQPSNYWTDICSSVLIVRKGLPINNPYLQLSLWPTCSAAPPTGIMKRFYSIWIITTEHKMMAYLYVTLDRLIACFGIPHTLFVYNVLISLTFGFLDSQNRHHVINTAPNNLALPLGDVVLQKRVNIATGTWGSCYNDWYCTDLSGN